MTRIEIETALDEGRLQAQMVNGNWWDVRRNGQTKTWKTRPTEFRIPVKMGCKSLMLRYFGCDYIDQNNMNWEDCWRVK